MPDRQLVIRQAADADLENIFDYSAENFGFRQAEHYLLDINSALLMLLENPFIGQPINIQLPDYFNFPVKSHRIIYRFSDSSLEVIRILHQSSLPEKYLKINS